MKTNIIIPLILSASTLLAVEPDRVVILLNERTQKALAEPLQTYVTDVERFPARLITAESISRNWMSVVCLRWSVGMMGMGLIR